MGRIEVVCTEMQQQYVSKLVDIIETCAKEIFGSTESIGALPGAFGLIGLDSTPSKGKSHSKVQLFVKIIRSKIDHIFQPAGWIIGVSGGKIGFQIPHEKKSLTVFRMTSASDDHAAAAHCSCIMLVYRPCLNPSRLARKVPMQCCSDQRIEVVENISEASDSLPNNLIIEDLRIAYCPHHTSGSLASISESFIEKANTIFEKSRSAPVQNALHLSEAIQEEFILQFGPSWNVILSSSDIVFDLTGTSVFMSGIHTTETDSTILERQNHDIVPGKCFDNKLKGFAIEKRVKQSFYHVTAFQVWGQHKGKSSDGRLASLIVFFIIIMILAMNWLQYRNAAKGRNRLDLRSFYLPFYEDLFQLNLSSLGLIIGNQLGRLE